MRAVMPSYRILPRPRTPNRYARAYRIRLGADHGVDLRGYLSALALWRHAELIKVSLLVRRVLAELCPAGLGCDDEEIRRPPTTQ